MLCSDGARNRARDAFTFGPPLDLVNRGGKPPSTAWPMLQRKRGLRVTSSGSWLRRGKELDTLSNALVALDSGTGAAMTLTGPMGAGKSRFLREIRDLAHKRRVPFYVGRCAPHGVDPPMEPYRDWLRQVTGADANGRNPVEALDALTQLGLSSEDTDVLERFMGGPGAPPRAERITKVLARVVRAMARVSPAVFALEDADRLSVSEVRFYANLVQRTADVPILWLASHREPVAEAFAALGSVVRLGAFDARAQRRLLATKLGVDDIGDALLAFVSRTCEGNPLYLEEMLRFLVQNGQVAVEDGRADYVASERAPTLPGSLHALVSSRLDDLDSASKGVLQLAATIGTDFSIHLLAEAAGMDDVRGIVDDLTQRHLLVHDTADTWAFVSELVRETVLHGILGVQRRDQHLLVASAIETLYADNLQPWHETLAFHCASGGRFVDAARYAHSAGLHMESAHFLDRALAAYQRGLHWIEQAPEHASTWDARTQGEAMLRFRIGTLLITMGDAAKGERALQLALDIASDAGMPWIEVRTHVALGQSYMQRGRPQLARAHLKQAHAMLQFEDDPELMAECLEAQAALALVEGRQEEAAALWENLLSAAGDDAGLRARCLAGLGKRQLTSGDLDAATRYLNEALDAAKTAEDRILQGQIENNLGITCAHRDDYDGALGWFRRSLRTREGIGYRRGVITNHHNIGDAHFSKGDYDRAWVAFERSRELAEQMQWDAGIALNDVFLGYIEARTRPEAGRQRIATAREAAARLGDVETHATGAWLLARSLAEAGDEAGAAALFNESVDEAQRSGLTRLAETIAAVRDAVSPTD